MACPEVCSHLEWEEPAHTALVVAAPAADLENRDGRLQRPKELSREI